ncbi:MAG: glycosyltransferase [Clostridia bacterium]|nr:glycosyltransferase [Clostridia bacterium]
MNLKIGLLNDSFPPTIDGVANCVKNYADIIAANYGTPTVITPEYPHVIDNYPYEVYRYSSVKFRGKMPYRVGNPFSPASILELKSKGFDILHNHCPFASGLLSHYIAGKKTPIVFTYHTKFDIDIDNFVHNEQFNTISKKFILNNINYSDEVWCVSHGSIESLRNLGYKGNVHVMPNGTDFKKGKSSIGAINDIRRIYKIDETTPVFAFCGRMMWYKNIKLILDGLKLLKNDGYKFKMLFIGGGPDRAAIEQYSNYLGLSAYVEFTGPIYDREKLRAIYSCIDMLLFPSTYDTSGLVVKEAAACDCAALLVKGSCASEGITDGVDGVLIDETPNSLAYTLAKVINTEGLFEKLGKAASNNIYFTWEQAVEKAYERYQNIIDKKSK